LHISEKMKQGTQLLPNDVDFLKKAQKEGLTSDTNLSAINKAKYLLREKVLDLEKKLPYSYQYEAHEDEKAWYARREAVLNAEIAKENEEIARETAKDAARLEKRLKGVSEDQMDQADKNAIAWLASYRKAEADKKANKTYHKEDDEHGGSFSSTYDSNSKGGGSDNMGFLPFSYFLSEVPVIRVLAGLYAWYKMDAVVKLHVDYYFYYMPVCYYNKLKILLKNKRK